MEKKGDYVVVGKFILSSGENKKADDEKDIGRGYSANYVQTNEEDTEKDSDDDFDADELDENRFQNIDCRASTFPEDNYANTYLSSIQIQLRGRAEPEEVQE